jgi:hypothetical protein
MGLRGPPKGRPKTPGSGRKKGVPPKPRPPAEPPKHNRYRFELAARGIADQFDVLKEMEGLAAILLNTIEAERKKEDADHKHIAGLMAQVYPILRDLAPYKHPRLAAVMVETNQRRPLNLAALSDTELAFLRQMLLKANAAPTTINVTPAVGPAPEKKSGPPR